MESALNQGFLDHAEGAALAGKNRWVAYAEAMTGFLDDVYGKPVSSGDGIHFAAGRGAHVTWSDGKFRLHYGVECLTDRAMKGHLEYACLRHLFQESYFGYRAIHLTVLHEWAHVMAIRKGYRARGEAHGPRFEAEMVALWKSYPLPTEMGITELELFQARMSA